MTIQNEIPTSEFIAQIQAGIGLIDPYGRLTQVNPYMARLLGYSTEALLGQPITAFIKPEHQTLLKIKLDKLKTGRNFFLPITFACKDGHQHESLLSFSGICSADLGYQGAAFFLLDIQQDLFLQLIIERQALQKGRQLSGLTQIMTEIARTNDLQRLLNLVFSSIRTATGFDGGGFFTYRSKLPTFYAFPQGTFLEMPAEMVTGLRRIRTQRPELMAKKVWDFSKINPSLEHAQLHHAFMNLIYPEKQAEMNAMLLFSSSDSNKSQCVFGFYHQSEQAFTSEMQEMADIITSHAAVTIENMFLYEEKESLAKESERLKLSRELHDSVAQGIYSLMLYGEASQRALNANKIDLVAENLEEMVQLSREAMSDLRLVIFELRPPKIEEIGFTGAVVARLESVEKRSGTQAACHIYGEPKLTSEAEVELYWVVHEALNNVLKHAQAEHVTVDIHCTDRSTLVIIKDDGVGFLVTEPITSTGIGFKSMSERVERLEGGLKVDSEPGLGTKIEIRVNHKPVQ